MVLVWQEISFLLFRAGNNLVSKTTLQGAKKVRFTACDSGKPVHTNPFSNENGAVLLWIQLWSTLQRRIQSPKMEPFENALQSGVI